MPDGQGLGLRAAKKQATRQQISDEATRLFLEQGFERTTIAEIAAAAGVAAKTVTNYFPYKEDLAFDQQEEFVGSLAAAVISRPGGKSPLAALRGAFGTAIQTQDPVLGFSGPDFARMVTESPTLTAQLRRLHDQREQALAEALAEADGGDRAEIEVRAAAAMLSAVHRVLFHRIQELTLEGLSVDEIAPIIGAEAERAFDMLESVLE